MAFIRSQTILGLHQQIGMLSTEWHTNLMDKYVGKYLFNYGIAHLIKVNQYKITISLLNNERYLLTRLRVLNSSGVQRLCDDISVNVTYDTSTTKFLTKWKLFFHKNRYLFQRGTMAWSADRIFLQRLFETQEKELSSKAMALADEQHFHILYSTPCLDINTGKMLLDGYLDVDHGGVLFFDNYTVVWGKQKIGLMQDNQFIWGHHFEECTLTKVVRYGEHLFAHFQTHFIRIDFHGEIDDYKNGWKIEFTQDEAMLLSKNRMLQLQTPTSSLFMLLPVPKKGRYIFWDGKHSVLCAHLNMLWLLNINLQRTIGPIVIENISNLRNWNAIWSNDGVLFWSHGETYLLFLDLQLNSSLLSIATFWPLELQQKISLLPKDFRIEEIQYYKGKYIAQLSNSPTRSRNTTNYLVEMEISFPGPNLNIHLIHKEPIKQLLSLNSDEVSAILKDGITLLIYNGENIRFIDSGLQWPNQFIKSRFDDGFFIVGDRSLAIFDHNDNLIQKYAFGNRLKPTFEFINDVLKTKIFEYSKGVFLWWDVIESWSHKVTNGWFSRINMGTNLTSLMYANKGITLVSVENCLSYEERQEHYMNTTAQEKILQKRMKHELFICTLEERDNHYALVRRDAYKEELFIIEENLDNIKIVDGNHFLICSNDELLLYEIFPDGEIEEIWCVDDSIGIYCHEIPALVFWVMESEACLLIEDSYIIFDDSKAVFLDEDGYHLFGSGNLSETLKWYPELFGFVLNNRTTFAAEGGHLCAKGSSSGAVNLVLKDANLPFHQRQILSQWHTRGAVSVERILNKEEIIIKCDEGLKILHLK